MLGPEAVAQRLVWLHYELLRGTTRLKGMDTRVMKCADPAYIQGTKRGVLGERVR